MRPSRDRLRKRRRLRGFVLTPLIDVIFLLLVFFMVCSQVAPYSLLDISADAVSRDDDAVRNGADAPSNATHAAQESGAEEILFVLSRGHIRAGRETITLAELPQALKAIGENGTRNVLLLSNRSATVQDIATTLEAFRGSKIDRVRFMAPRAAGGQPEADRVRP